MRLPGINCGTGGIARKNNYTGVAIGVGTGALHGPACSTKRTRRTMTTIAINNIKATCA